jgi:hypothetical protein
MSSFDPTLLDNKTFNKTLEVWRQLLLKNPEVSIRLAYAKVIAEENRRRMSKR